ncbi:MAG TPA: hypothetical protein DCQ76_02655 [Ruminococcaceae bacterium]|nr:hypothetical protein [Oscillospiraceae bacterium]
MSFSGFITVEVLSLALFYVFSGKARLHTCILDRNKRSTNIAFALFWLLCILFGIFIFAGIFKPAAAYPFDRLYNKNAYEQQFDAFLKHQLYIDIEPSQELLALSNPYDRASRTGISFLWDRALYGGKYYSYFGIAPIITVYYPYYFITGKVPSAATVCFILFTAAVTAVAITYLKAVKIFCKNPNKVLVFFGFAAVETGSLLFMLLVSADMYYTAVISGVCFLSLFMMFSLAAYGKKKTAAKCVEFFLAGISLVLTVMSRPNMALMSVIMVPLYLNVLCRKDLKPKVKILSVLSFAFPVLIGAAFQMWYNYARFSSVFDFGSAYQLTVADVSKYAVTPALFLPAIYHYFLQLPDFKTEFPFFHLSADVYAGSYKKYIYFTRTMGMFNLPASVGIFGVPCVLTKKTEFWKRATFLLGVIMPVAVVFLDMCLGGVNIRYLADIAFVTVLFGTLIIINLYSAVPDNQKTLKFISYIIFTLVLFVSALVGALTVFENERYSNFSILG